MTRPSATLALPTPVASLRARPELLARLMLATVMLAAGWLGVAPYTATPAVVPASAPAGVFSAERAMADLAVVAAERHPTGSDRQAAVRDYLLGQIAALGLAPEVQRATITRATGQHGMYNTVAVENILVRVPGSASDGAILLDGHYDSVGSGPGTTDCGACAVTVLETLRAIVAGPRLANDVIFLLADAEEVHIAGAEAFMDQHPWASDVRFSLVFEGMGYDGASMLYFAEPQSGWWVEQALDVAPHPLGFSYIGALMQPLGGSSSDLEAYIADGRPGLAFVSFNLASAAAYHTGGDNLANFDPRSLQHHGDYAVSLLRHFGNLPLGQAPAVANPVHFPLVPFVLARYPAGWALPLALVAAVGFVAVLALGWRRGQIQPLGVLGGSLAFLVQLVGVVIVVSLAWQGVRLVHPGLQAFSMGGSYGAPNFLWAVAALTLALVVAVHNLLRQRLALGTVAMGVLAWWVLLAVLASLGAPGLSYIFTWPALAALAALGWDFARRSGVERERAGGRALAAWGVPAVVSLVLVAPLLVFLFFFAGRLEGALGVPLVAVPMLFAALLIGLLLPAIEVVIGGMRRWLPAGAALVFVLGAAVPAVLVRPSPQHPVSNSITYWLDASTGQARWITVDASANGQARLDEWTRQFFPEGGQATTFKPFLNGLIERELPALEAPAPVVSLPASTVDVLADTTEAGTRQLRLRVSAPAGVVDGQVLITATGPVAAISANGTPLDLGGQSTSTVQVNVIGRHADGAVIELTAPDGLVTVTVQDHYLGLPTLPGFTVAPRPGWMVTAPLNDVADATIVSQAWEL
jgi:hypothetical protein